MDKNMLCSRCKMRLAVIYMTRLENGQTISEGLCLKCAKELGLKPVDDLMNKMGLSEEDLDKVSDQMMEAMGDLEEGDEDGFEKGGAMWFLLPDEGVSVNDLLADSQTPGNIREAVTIMLRACNDRK